MTWSGDGDLQPRAVLVDGASDRRRLRVDGVDLGETAPVEDMAVLTHWVEFHSSVQRPGERAEADVVDCRRQRVSRRGSPLPKALPAEGKAEIEMTLRADQRRRCAACPSRLTASSTASCLELLPAVYVKAVSFDTEKPGPRSGGSRSRSPWRTRRAGRSTGKIRTVYGRYRPACPTRAACPQRDAAEQAVSCRPAESTVQVVRDETPPLRHLPGRRSSCSSRGDKLLDAGAAGLSTP